MNIAKATGRLPGPPAVPPASAQVDEFPYPFWPALPYEDVPVLADFDVEVLITDDQRVISHQERRVRDEQRALWLRTKPNMLQGGDERRWHGSRLIGAGGYGCVGLWVERDENDNVVDVSTEADHHVLTDLTL